MSIYTENRTYEDCLGAGQIVPLLTREREQHEEFQKAAYKEDLDVANMLLHKVPRWSIISSYYAMHDLTRLYLVQKLGVKLAGQSVHETAIIALEKALKDPTEQEQAIALLEQAQQEYEETVQTRGKPKPHRELPEKLDIARRTRGPCAILQRAEHRKNSNKGGGIS